MHPAAVLATQTHIVVATGDMGYDTEESPCAALRGCARYPPGLERDV